MFIICLYTGEKHLYIIFKSNDKIKHCIFKSKIKLANIFVNGIHYNINNYFLISVIIISIVILLFVLNYDL